MTDYNNKKIIRENTIIRLQILMDDIRQIKSQIWGLVASGVSLLGLVLWFFNSFQSIKGGSNLTLLLVSSFMTIMVFILFNCFINYLIKKLKEYRNSSYECKDMLGLSYNPTDSYSLEWFFRGIFFVIFIVLLIYLICFYIYNL